MQRLIQVLTALVLIGLLVLVGMTIWFAWSVKPTVETTLRDVHTTVLEIGLTAANLRKASLAWESASKVQAQESTSVLIATKNSLASMQTDVHSVAVSANSLLLLTTKAIDHQDQSLQRTQENLQENLSQMLTATQQLQKTLVDADKVISDPAIRVSIDNLSLATEQANHGMEQLAAIATDGRQVADKARETYMKPVNIWWTLLKQLISTGGSMAQMVK